VADDIRHLLRAGGYQVPDDEECGRLQAYWDELTARAPEVRFGSGEIALLYLAWRQEDD
jgi:hypothetical protein